MERRNESVEPTECEDLQRTDCHHTYLLNHANAETPNSNLQAPEKFQASNFKAGARFTFLEFDAWRLVLLWMLELGACTSENFASGPEISVPKDLPRDTSHAQAAKKRRGCLECHAGSEPMHASKNVVLGCTDCHGGNATPGLTQHKAHVAPRNPVFWQSSANPNDSTVLLNHESAEFIQFMNPGDLRVAEKTCGPCHGEIVRNVGHSMMRHGAMLWGAALYNNGAYPAKNYRFGQAYGLDGAPLRLESPVPVTPEMTQQHGILPFIDPLPRFDINHPRPILPLFERRGEAQSQ